MEGNTQNGARSCHDWIAEVKLGIVIPTLGLRLDYLALALESVIAQPHPIQLVVVRPLAASNTVDALARRFGAKVVDDPGMGLSAAVNIGERSLDPDIQYFNWLGDDDCLKPMSVGAAAEALETSPSVVAVYGNCEYVDLNGKKFYVNRPPIGAQVLAKFGPNKVPQPGALIRRSSFRLVGGLNEELKYAMDLDLWLKLNKVGRLRKIPATLAAYRWHPESLSSNNGEQPFLESSRVRLNHASGMLVLLCVIFDFAALKLGLVRNNRLNSKLKN